MEKLSAAISNDYYPQTLFLYGVYREDEQPSFGLFCWTSYCFDGGMRVMTCIGSDKLTRRRIDATGEFTANLVTEPLLPMADYMGKHRGDETDKAALPVKVEKGRKVNAPVLCDSPATLELSVERTCELNEGKIYVCKIECALLDKRATEPDADMPLLLRRFAPVRTTAQTYFSFDGRPLGKWGEPGKAFLAPPPAPDPFKPGVYRHFKGNYYELLYLARDSETLADTVIYRALYGERGVWARPASMWNEEVSPGVKRFTWAGEG